MQAQIILGFGVLILAGGSLSMLILHRCTPNLQGMGRLSACFASGMLGAGLLLVNSYPFVCVLAADLALLASFVLLHMAVLELVQHKEVHLWHGLVPLGIQIAVDLASLWVYWHGGHWNFRPRVVCLGLLLCLQAFVTAGLLWRVPEDNVRTPAMYSAILLSGFGLFNLGRSAVLAFGLGDNFLHQNLTLISLALFLLVALGLAFGFFWMTTASLTAEVEYMASTDPLTRVYNRRIFLKWCEKELLRTQRSQTPFSLLMIDLDHFKRVNDNFGHQRGDEVLCAAVERMQDSVRGIDILCRWGGEEFAVLLPSAPTEATRLVAERIRENIHRMQIPLESSTQDEAGVPLLTVSIGAATYRGLEDDIAAMLLRADRALYRAKHGGRNQVLVGA